MKKHALRDTSALIFCLLPMFANQASADTSNEHSAVPQPHKPTSHLSIRDRLVKAAGSMPTILVYNDERNQNVVEAVNGADSAIAETIAASSRFKVKRTFTSKGFFAGSGFNTLGFDAAAGDGFKPRLVTTYTDWQTRGIGDRTAIIFAPNKAGTHYINFVNDYNVWNGGQMNSYWGRNYGNSGWNYWATSDVLSRTRSQGLYAGSPDIAFAFVFNMWSAKAYCRFAIN